MFGEEITQPEIMVAADVINPDAAPDEVSQHKKHLMVLLGNNVFVFEPEIKKVAENHQPVTIDLYLFEQGSDFRQLLGFLVFINRTQMGVGKNV
jgi:hypothetical protein